MLEGKIIINTRPAGSADLIGEALRTLGATVLPLPLIKIQPIPIAPEILLAVKEKAYQWLVFTSRNGVEQFFQQLQWSPGMALPFKTAVFGGRTAKAMKGIGFTPDIISRGNSSANLLTDLKDVLTPNNKVLLVLGNLATDLLQENLQKIVDTKRVNAYQTVYVDALDPEIVDTIAMGKYDLILFTSPSGFKSFKHHTQSTINLKKLRAACIGATTEEALLADGLKPLVVAEPAGKEGLIKGIKKLFANTAQEVNSD